MAWPAREPMNNADIKKLRSFFGVSAVAFGHSIGVGGPMIYALEKGTTKPSAQTQRGLARLSLARDMIELAREDGTWQSREERFWSELDNRPHRGIEGALHKVFVGEVWTKYELQADVNRIRGNGGKLDIILVTLQARNHDKRGAAADGKQYWRMVEPCADCGQVHQWDAGYAAGARRRRDPKRGMLPLPADDPTPFLGAIRLHKRIIELVELTADKPEGA